MKTFKKKREDESTLIEIKDVEAWMQGITDAIERERKEQPIKYYTHLFWLKLDLKGRYYNIKNGVPNLIKWLPVIWKDRDWDEAYLLEIMSFKMKQMSRLQEVHGHLVGSEMVAAQLLYCSEIIERINKDDYYIHPDVVKLKGEGKVRESFELQNKLLEDDLDELFKVMRKNIRGWWD